MTADPPLIVPRLIERKRDGEALHPDEWSALIQGYLAGDVPEYQISALLMAVVWRGLTPDELSAVTEILQHSGRTMQWSGDVSVVDKHSTGGVGDKVSLVLAPLVASCGVAVPMMSGRGLGHTGGTLDKLEAIPGFRTDLSLSEAQRQVERIGCAMIGQTAEIAPADRRLYALRDVTGTVESIPLVAASIMSKKLAEGLSGLVLDVKRGSGAFLPELAQSLELAAQMIGLGAAHGCETVALVTAMDRPLGRACGNALETEEALTALRGEGPPDLLEVTFRLGAEMLLIGGAADTPDEARARLEGALASGKALETFRKVIEAQNGVGAVVDDPALLPQSAQSAVVAAPSDGFVQTVEPRTLGRAIVAMGGGRRTMTDTIDPSCGFLITVKPGDRVSRGEPIATVFGRDDDALAIGLDALDESVRYGVEPPSRTIPLVSHRVTADGATAL